MCNLFCKILCSILFVQNYTKINRQIIYFLLFQIQLFSVGDMVQIIDDLAKMKDLQKGHGEWIEVMKGVSRGIIIVKGRMLSDSINIFKLILISYCAHFKTDVTNNIYIIIQQLKGQQIEIISGTLAVYPGIAQLILNNASFPGEEK